MRIILPDLITINETLTLTDKSTISRITDVLRLKPNHLLTVINPTAETSHTARIEAISAKAIELTILSEDPPKAELLPNTTLAMALIKGQRWDWLLQKATELGVREIQPLLTDHTVVDWKNGEHKLARWAEICKSAVEQCDGRFLPIIHEPLSLQPWLKQHPNNHPRLVLMERGPNRQPFRHVIPAEKPDKLTLVIGPEGGLSDSEADTLIAAGFTNVQLGNRILRAETAAIAALSAVVAAYDEPD